MAQIEEAVAFTEQSPVPPPESLYEDVYVRSPYINMKAAEKDPAWKAATKRGPRAGGAAAQRAARRRPSAAALARRQGRRAGAGPRRRPPRRPTAKVGS